MACQIKKMAVFTLLLLCALPASAQVSGIPGDGIPDLYYFPSEGLTVLTSLGLISRPAGVMTLDADGFDINAILVGGPNVVQPPACGLCEGFSLPQDAASGNFAANNGNYTVGYSGTAPNGSSQFIRSNNPAPPANGRGFLGVVGTGWFDYSNNQQPWLPGFPPIINYPTTGIANYGPGLTADDFTRVFNDGTTEALWSVRVASGATGASKFTNVTVVVPEPTSGLLSVLGLAALSLLRRR